jgi:hypothetical protein
LASATIYPPSTFSSKIFELIALEYYRTKKGDVNRFFTGPLVATSQKGLSLLRKNRAG